MIKRSFSLLSLLIFSAACVASVPATSTAELAPLPQHSMSTRLITNFISQYHYKQTRLNDAQSAEILAQFIKSLDPNRNLFTEKEINAFEKYSTRLDDALQKRDLSIPFDMVSLSNERRVARVDHAIALLDTTFDFTIDESYRFDRRESPWAKNEAELDQIWRKRVKNDVLNLKLAKKSDEELKKTLKKRYERIKTRTTQFQPEDAYELFINASLKTIEPHTAYLSPRNSENFNINMSLSLEGIGAVLQTVDEHTMVRRIITGGPADMSGLLYAEDRITAVGQGAKAELVDVVGWRIDDVVQLIRGPKDSVVRLQVLPKTSGLDGPAKIITIVRNKIKLEEQQAKKSIIDVPGTNGATRIGVITIPTFYRDFAAEDRREKDYRSTTRDTRALIKELQKENVSGIVIDLRTNGGGSLIEAITLTGLFIKTGPVVQVRNHDGDVTVERDTDQGIAYTGPLAVLVNRYSASASEIFSGAIQDYGRGTILGEATFGKGTVQSVINLTSEAKRRGVDSQLGHLNLTMAQFFRVNGDSTQHRGVVPDIIFPTAENNDDEGERSLDNALPWANIAPARYALFSRTKPDLSAVSQRHLARVAKDEGFGFLLSQSKDRHRILDKKTVSLLEKERHAEREALETNRHERINSFRVSRGLEPVTREETLPDENDIPDDDSEKFTDEVEQIEVREAAAILADLINGPAHTKQHASHQPN